tara:strand:+ start:11890 stop:12261 length:372 start_codon:yes stop_codon:yes gene_type:complete
MKKNKYSHKKFCFDIDGVICKTINSNYEKSVPNKNVINMINKLYKKGNKIKIFTSRYMGRSSENIKHVNKYKSVITKQLKKWNLKYNDLIIGKPSYDVFVDDKAFGFKKNWIKKFKKNYSKYL